MLNKKQQLITFLGATVLLIQPFSMTGVTTTVAAETIEQNQQLQEPETKEIESPELIEAVKENNGQNLENQIEVVDNTEITTLVDENEVVQATEIVDTETNQQIAITNTGDSVIIERTTINDKGEQETIQEIYPVIQEDIQDSLTQNRLVYSGWTYTHLAVGRTAFSVVAGMGISAITAAFAGIFGIAKKAASFVVTYMGIKGGMNSTSLARALDSNGNGWIALYKRSVRYYKGGKIIGYEHRTY